MASSDDDYRIEEASPTGGKVFNDPKEGEMLRRSLQYLAQRVGGAVLSGNVNFTRMSMPVHLNEPRSLLERITDDWAYAPHFLMAAARSKDPVERLKLVAAFVVSGLHCMKTLGKPFNPILGSTYQTTLDDGTPCYVEQTSHHPPVTHYYIKPESGEYLLAGFSGIDGRVAWGLDTGLSTRRIGINVVQFADGTRIVYNLPRMLVRGLGAERKAEFLGPFNVLYEAHNLVFDFLLDPPQPFCWSPFGATTPSDYMDGVLYRLSQNASPENDSIVFTGAFQDRKGAFFGNPDEARKIANEENYTAVELRTDEQVSLSVTSATQERSSSKPSAEQNEATDREIICFARGSFLGYFDVDGTRLWDIRHTPKSELTPSNMENAIGSDCRYREDVDMLRKALDEVNDEATRERLTVEAQALKEKLETIQRADRKWRKEGLINETEKKTLSDGGKIGSVQDECSFDVSGGQMLRDGIGGTVEETPFFPTSLQA
ncbi:unnamed protein product [Chondrus crispus]|uniref:Oxysterol-binding protein n=1 Tax=Chondrus crispus TaxID=2769 RepID=R7Q226_CHOCR|nr:unnamed protein product [Chondrus crispus]CDF32104.1 unnamed protein product [Chondrus crispus]|eukprot:XP_005711769.1 unnamed protein product [Chondrus crispus]